MGEMGGRKVWGEGGHAYLFILSITQLAIMIDLV